eukprot:g5845.t1
MSDELDWDDDDFEVSEIVTIGQQKLAEEHQAKFQDEDVEEKNTVKKTTASSSTVKSKPKKEPPKYANRGAEGMVQEEPLDDPVAEKLRQAKRQEEADYRNALDVFGDTTGHKLEDFTPVSEKDFEKFARLVVLKYLAPYKMNSHYKHMLKSFLKDAVVGLPSNEIRDLETCLAGVRFEKTKLEKSEKEAAAKRSKKASLKFERSSMSAGLDENIYDVDEDDYDFM